MKAKEAPEKLYVELCSDGVYAHAREWGNSDNIEYTRTDAFIEKACEAYCKMCKMPNCRVNECKFIEKFVNYMKGE